MKNIKDYAKMAIRNLLHANSCVHSRRLIAEFSEDGIKDGIWQAGPSDIRDAAFHESDKDAAAKLAYRKLLNDLDLKMIEMLERDKRARENIEINLTLPNSVCQFESN